MNGLEFSRIGQWPWILLLPVLVLVLWSASARRSRLAGIYGAVSADRTLSTAARTALLSLVAVLSFACWLDPRLGEETVAVERRGLDIVFCLDTSRSMLARDAEPNRLARAIADIRAVLPALKNGDRVALVVFAGRARVWVPLTHDIDSFRELLAEVDANVVPVGGTDIGSALSAAEKLLDPSSRATSVVVVSTDGEDHAKTGQAAAARLGSAGVVVHCVGYGDARGSKIAILERGEEVFLKDEEGRDVVSAMDADSLRAMAHGSGGEFVRADAMALPLLQLYEKRVVPMQKRSYEASEERQKKARYQWVLLPTLVLLMLEMFLSGGSAR
ncbi:MAG: hypothetical protein Fur0037_15510 [Planctomycetota bacterium]